jgi:hypothetical protein
MRGKFRLPSPALVIACVALAVALSGTAVAAGVVPLAKRALVADNAKKLGGKTSAAIVSQASSAPGPASTAASLISTKSAPFSVGPGGEQIVTATCDAGSKATGGGFLNPTSALVLSAGAGPNADGSGWTEDLVNLSDTGTGVGVVTAVCAK